jgi:hypothetical protein
MPVEQRLALAQRPEFVLGHEALQCDRAQIGDEQLRAFPQRLGPGPVEQPGEARRAIGRWV